jgi:hypothetical protein
MKTFRIFMMITMIAFLVTITGCCCGGGTDTVVVEKEVAAPQVNVGDELLKLQQAKDQGTITEEEFEAAKKKLLKD